MLEGLGKIWESGSNLAATSCTSIKDSYNSMASSTYGKKIVDFIVAPVDKKSAREAYYTHSDYVSEFYCTISNIGIIGAGLYYGDYSAIAAGAFSALSHAIPSQRLHDLDLLGVALVGINVAANYDVALKRPDVLIWGAGAMALNVIDTVLARNVSSEQFSKIEPWLHVAWHLSAGLALYKFNSAKADLARSQPGAVDRLSETFKNYLPGYKSIQNIASTCSAYIPEVPEVLKRKCKLS